MLIFKIISGCLLYSLLGLTLYSGNAVNCDPPHIYTYQCYLIDVMVML